MALTAERVFEKVSKAIQDTSFSEEEFIPWINECINYIAGKALLSTLQTSAELTTDGTGSKDMPANFHRMLFYCYNKTAKMPVHIYKNTALLQNYNNTGNISGVALQGTELFYKPEPSVNQTLVVNYYRQPTEIVSSSDTITDLPIHVASQLLHYYLCSKCYEMIEDGIDSAEGGKVNTTYYAQQFNAQLKDFLKDHQPEHEPLPMPTSDVLNFETYLL